MKKKKTLLLIISIIILGVLGLNSTCDAQSAKSLYYMAENAYTKLRHDAKKQKYRSYWFDCIKKFKAVYEYDPDGPWAAAGLYRAGILYWELYQHSYYDGDIKEAEDVFHRIVDHFPQSRYHKKALDSLERIGKPAPKQSIVAAQNSKSDEYAKKQFSDAQACYQRLLRNRTRQKYRDQWEKCIHKFESVYRYDPQGPWAAASLYMAGMLYEGLAGYSFLDKDEQEAVGLYDQIIRDYPGSRYKQKAEQKRYKLTGAYQNDVVARNTPNPPSTGSDTVAGVIPHASEASLTNAKNSQGAGTTISGIRYWSNPSYTRVVVDAEGDVKYDSPHLLDKNPSLNKPQRLYFDVHNSQLDKNLKKYIAIDDNLLSAVRAAQNTKDSVRVVIDIKSYKAYKIFRLLEPTRIVIDVWGVEGMTQATTSPESRSSSEEKLSPGALAKQLALGVRKIVIDPGHGGRDPGAVGYVKNVYEKNITLDISRRLADKIRTDLGCDVILTRSSDKSISLEERTAFANTQNADLFISIHVNAHRNQKAYGLETYYLNLATDDESIRVAARENATSEKNISDLESILSDLMQNAKINESSRLATYVQRSMYGNMKSKYKYVKNNGVKKAPFYVLLGAQMPSILIETSFISNERECKRLVSPTYQNHLCESIVKGIRNYIKETSPNTLSRR